MKVIVLNGHNRKNLNNEAEIEDVIETRTRRNNTENK